MDNNKADLEKVEGILDHLVVDLDITKPISQEQRKAIFGDSIEQIPDEELGIYGECLVDIFEGLGIDMSELAKNNLKDSRFEKIKGKTLTKSENWMPFDVMEFLDGVKPALYRKVNDALKNPDYGNPVWSESSKLISSLKADNIFSSHEETVEFVDIVREWGIAQVSNVVLANIDDSEPDTGMDFTKALLYTSFNNEQFEAVSKYQKFLEKIKDPEKRKAVEEQAKVTRDKIFNHALYGYRKENQEGLAEVTNYKEKPDEIKKEKPPKQRKTRAKVTKAPYRGLVKLMKQAKAAVEALYGSLQNSVISDAFTRGAWAEEKARFMKDLEKGEEAQDEEEKDSSKKAKDGEGKGGAAENKDGSEEKDPANNPSEQENGGEEQSYEGEREDLITKLKLLMLHNKTVTVVLSEGKFKNVSEDDKQQHLKEMISRYEKADTFMSRIGEYDIEKIQKKIDSYSVPKISNSEAIAKEFPEINITNPLQAGKCAQEMILESMNTESKLCDKTLQVFFGKNVTREQLQKLGIAKIKTNDMRQFNAEYERICSALKVKGKDSPEKLTGEEMESRFLAQRTIENRKKLMDDKGD